MCEPVLCLMTWLPGQPFAADRMLRPHRSKRSSQATAEHNTRNARGTNIKAHQKRKDALPTRGAFAFSSPLVPQGSLSPSLSCLVASFLLSPSIHCCCCCCCCFCCFVVGFVGVWEGRLVLLRYLGCLILLFFVTRYDKERQRQRYSTSIHHHHGT